MEESLLAASLSAKSGYYNTKLFTLVEHFDSLTNLYNLWLKQDTKIPPLLLPHLQAAWQEPSLKTMADRIKKEGIDLLLFSDDAFPEQLRDFDDKPYLLYTKGNQALLHSHYSVSCVGSRLMTDYGKRVIHSLVRDLPKDCLVISGLALGVDAEVHRAALEYTIPTLAVLGGGLDRFEPQTNHTLATKILQNEGLILSEYPPGVRPAKHHFLERNRIVAGLACMTIVIEGREHSGSLVTARYAAQYGREVGAVPADIFSLNGAAGLRLLKEGAFPVSSSDDILTILNYASTPTQNQSPDYGEVYTYLKLAPASLDTMQEALNLPLATIQEQVTLLELEGLISLSAAGHYMVLV